MKTAILQYPGGHGDEELKFILTKLFDLEVKDIWYKDHGPFDADLLFLGGGFPCLDHHETDDCFKRSPALQHLKDFSDNGGMIMGIANGFQVLCEAGLLPGQLERNESDRFICRQVYIKPENHSCPLTSNLKEDQVFRLPLATYRGRYRVDEEVLGEMRQDGQILFRFCDYQGRITESVNYTASQGNIAAICNGRKNVFGIIPQPERASELYGGNLDGKSILSSLLGLKEA